jgi:MFS superfamily sulfate permease-like transporter
MRKTFLILALIFTVVSIIFTALPLDTLALAPIGLALLFIFIAFKKSSIEERKLPKRLFIVVYICALIVLGKTYLIKDEIAVDNKFEQEKIETKQEAKKDLEELEGLE